MPSQFTQASPGISLSTTVVGNVVTQLIPAGSWLVWAQVDFALTAATLTELQAGISLTSAALPSQAGGGGLGPDSVSILPLLLTLLSTTASIQCGPTAVTLAAPANVYLVSKATFSAGTVTAYGTLNVVPAAGSSFNLMSS